MCFSAMSEFYKLQEGEITVQRWEITVPKGEITVLKQRKLPEYHNQKKNQVNKQQQENKIHNKTETDVCFHGRNNRCDSIK